MGSIEFHTKKIDEILDSLQSNDNLFLTGVSLFYLGVHLIDLYLATNGYEQVNNHGERKNLLRKLDGNLLTLWDSLFSLSNDQRYNSLTTQEHIRSMIEDIHDILSITNIPEDIKHKTRDTLSSLP